jgi:queuine/archaeosine tRNA-ribosyltransferase
MRIQRVLNSDIVMIFDECTPYPATATRRRRVDALSLRWAQRSRDEHDASEPKRLFGIVQGGMYEDLRDESLAGLTDRLRRLRHRRPVGRRAQGRHAAHPRAHRAAPAAGQAALPDGRRHARGHGAGVVAPASTCSTA